MATIVELRDVSIRFKTLRGWGYAVSGVSADIVRHRVTAIIGESGSGKSVLGAAIMGLLPYNAELRGSIRHEGREMVGLPDRAWDEIRGSAIGWVAQNPLSALNPVYRADELVAEAAIHRRVIPRRGKRGFSASLLARVRLDPGVGRKYSFELSGGMAQRALIATGIGLEPPLLILDEPTKGLDPDNVERIGTIIADLAGAGHTLLVITHDIALAQRIADEIWVFYGSRLVEQADAGAFFDDPRHPYSQGLLAAMPARGLRPIPGESPSFFTPPVGCPFAQRCPRACEACAEHSELVDVTAGRRVMCLFP